MKTAHFSFAILLFVLFALTLSSCDMPGLAPATETPTSIPTATPTLTPIPPTPTPTVTPTITQTLTPRPNLTATLLYENFSNKLDDLYKAGHISTREGKYKRMADFVMELAQINYYNWTESSEGPANFVLDSDVSWESASPAADNSGCGIVFHLNEKGDHYLFYISLKGFISLDARINNEWTQFGGPFYGNAQQNGKVNFTLIVQDTITRVLINNQLVKIYQGFEGKISHGELAYTVLSGTNTSYGTRCRFTDTGLWTLP